MNKTKRKIFETSMKLFAEKGYDATSIEEITSVVGVAKGTLYYHFSSKEEIFNFLVDEGIKLLKNSIEIKTSKLDNTIDKLRAIILIEIKIIMKYENIISILLSQIWGTEPRNLMCKEYLFEYIKTIENIVKEGIEKGEIIERKSGSYGIAEFSVLHVQVLSIKLKQKRKLILKKCIPNLKKQLLRDWGNDVRGQISDVGKRKSNVGINVEADIVPARKKRKNLIINILCYNKKHEINLKIYKQ